MVVNKFSHDTKFLIGLFILLAVIMYGLNELYTNKVVSFSSQEETDQSELNCRTRMPFEVLDNTKNYITNYHINGRSGNNVEWKSTEAPLGIFNIFNLPSMFFVKSDSFEGCGYVGDLFEVDTDTLYKISFGSKFNCNGKLIYITTEESEFFIKNRITVIEGNQANVIDIFSTSDYSNIDLSNNGCFIE